MRLRVTLIDWKYPESGQLPRPEIWDLLDEAVLFELYMSLANGILVEARLEADSPEARDVALGMITGVGGCSPVTLDAQTAAPLWLYEEGYACYQQGVTDPAYLFIDLTPRPEWFA